MRENGRSTSSLSLISNGRNGVTTSTSFPVTLHQRIPHQPKFVAPNDDAEKSDWYDIGLWIQNNKAKLPRIIIMTLFMCTATYQVVDQIRDYIGFPTGVNVLVDQPSSLREALPGVTLCHNNRFMKSKIINLYKDWLKSDNLTDEIKEKLEKQVKPLNSSRYEEHFIFNSFIEDKFGEFASILMLSHFTVTAEEFIKYLKCDPSWTSEVDGRKSDCEDYSVIQFMHYTGRCFTLFHNLTSYTDIIDKIGIKRKNTLMKNPKNHIIDGGDFIAVEKEDAFSFDNSSSNSQTKTTTTSDQLDEKAKPYDFAPNEIIQIMLNFTPNELMDPYAKPSGRIYIHDISHIPGMEEIYFDLEPGYYYEFYIRAIRTNQLPAPYNTNCSNYFDEAVEKIKETGSLGYPFTQSECIQECLIEHTLDQAQMTYPPEAPWFKNSRYSNRSVNNEYHDKKLRPRWGRWRMKYPSSSSRKTYHGYALLYLPGCMANCGIDCSRTTYEVIDAKDRWPFKDIIETATKEEKERIEMMQKTAAFVSIRYSTYVQTVRDFEPRFGSVEGFIAGIGGLISMWVGISALSLYDSIVNFIIKYHSSH